MPARKPPPAATARTLPMMIAVHSCCMTSGRRLLTVDKQDVALMVQLSNRAAGGRADPGESSQVQEQPVQDNMRTLPS